MRSEESHHDLCPDGELACWLHDPATRKLLRANDSAMELYGWDGDVVGTSLETVATNPSDRETLLHPTAGFFVDGGSHSRRKGAPIRVDVNVQEKQVDGRPAMLVTVIDVSDRKLDEVQLLKRERQLADEARRKAEFAHAEISEILERITDAFVALDRNWRYIYVNEKAAQIFGRDREDLVGKHIWTEFPEGVGQPFHLAYEKAMQTQEAVQIEEYYPPYERWFENRIHPSPKGLAIYFQDITERHHAEDRIRHQALHDDLTGLPNRVLFNDRLEQAIAHAHRSNSCLAVMTLDLDRFKFVNDNLGHSIGDIVIRDVAARLSTALRSTDTIARLGGDEFAIIIEDVENDQHARAIAEKALAIFEDPFDAGTSSVRVTCSVGISVYPRDGHDGEMLFRNSESALAKARESGHGYVRMFDESMSARYRDRLVREQELREAIDGRQLTSYYQPILRGDDRRIVGVEALSRWNHPQRGLVGPEEFIPLAEETRMIVAIGEFVLRRGCLDVGRWIDQGHDLKLSVNLSVRQFQEKTLLHTIDSILAETKFDPSRLELEVTETAAMQNVDLTMSLLRELRQRGISIAIDDFGVGQTSLIYLRQFPINTIKIDKVFINDLLTDATDAAIVKTIIELAHTLGLGATAEGVESEEQVVMLQEFGCDLLQGFHFSRPVPSATLETLLSA